MRYGTVRLIPQYVSGVRKWWGGRQGFTPRVVVIHRMEGNLNGSDSWLRSAASGSASTHFAVGYWGALNRMLRRATIVTWVDTVNTAYGWNAQPNGWTPTLLARRMLSDILYQPYKDLNSPAIHIEVEGYHWQVMHSQLAAKLKELLGAIARVHGPLVIMAHTDCSAKPCPGMAGVPWTYLGGYGGKIGTPLPKPAPTPAPAPKEPPVIVKVKAEEWRIRSGAYGYRSSSMTGTRTQYGSGRAVSICESADGTLRLLTSGYWVRRSDLTPTVPGGDPAFNRRVVDAYNS